MKFCARCEKPLEFLEFLDGDLCAACSTKKTEPTKTAEEHLVSADLGELADTSIGLENGRITLKSPEGWTLWSAPSGEVTELKTILHRARRILEIRRKNRR